MRLCVRAAVVGSILLFLPGLLEQFEAPKAAVVRILGIAALAATTAGLTSKRPRPQWIPLDAGVLAWLLVELLATLASVSPRISFFGDTKQSEGLLTSLGLAGLYFGARAAARAETRGTLALALAAAAVAALYAALQALGVDPTAWAHIATYERAGPFMRPFGTLGHPNVLGIVTAAATASALPLAMDDQERRWVWAGLAALFGAVTAVTLSRGAWLGALAGAGVALALIARERGAGARRAAPWIGGAGVVLAIGLVLAGFGPTLVHRLQEILHPGSGSARSRLEIWRVAWRAWHSRPWLGVGPDAFELVFQRFQTPEYWRFEWATVPAHAHSIFLHALATRGLAGLLAGAVLLAGWLLAAREAWRRGAQDRTIVVSWMAGVAAMAVAGGFGALGISGAAWMAVAAGSLVALGSAEGTTTPARAAASSPRKRGETRGAAAAGEKHAPRIASLAARGRAPQVAAAIPALLVAALSIAQLLASRSAFEALDWAPRGPGDGDPARARRAADRATRLAPWDDQPQYYRAQALLRVAAAAGSTEPLDPAETSARRAIALEPRRALDHQCLGTVLLARARAGDPAALAAARAAFDRATALAPYNALLWLQLADAEIALGHPAEALPRIRRALALYPDVEIARQMLERAQAAAEARSRAAPPG